jgi:hypothetical protein
MQMSVQAAMDQAREACTPDRPRWWMIPGALIELQQQHPGLYHPRPEVYAPLWRWMADKAHRQFVNADDVYLFCRSALVISYISPAHPSVKQGPEYLKVPIGQATTVTLPRKAAETVALFMSKTELRYD